MKQLLLDVFVVRLLAIVLSLALSACSSSEDEMTRYIHRVKNRAGKTIEPIPEFKPLAKFVFPEDTQRRSPFKPALAERQEDSYSPNMKRSKQPLEAFSLDTLKFVGTLKQDNTMWGLIRQSSGVVSRVKVGDYMGKDYGQIVMINDKKMLIEETVQGSGRWEKKKVTIEMQSLD